MFDDKGDAPPAPDYSPLIKVSQEMAKQQHELSREQFSWAKQAYAENKSVNDEVINRFLDTQEQQSSWATEDRNRYKQSFQPLEDSLISDAQSYASEGRKDLERGRAMSNVSQQFEAARNNAVKELESYGINPAATRYAALDLGLRAQEAATRAAAANQADQATDATARGLRSEAINIGRGYPGQSNQTQSIGMQGGTGAANTGLATTASGANTMGTGAQWAGIGNQSLGNAGSMMNMQHNNALASYKAEQESSSGIGSALGLAAGVGAKAFLGGSMPWSFAAMPFAAQGGAIPDPNMVPGSASPSGGEDTDDVSARLTAGEYVIPADVVKHKGHEFFEKLIMSSRKGKEQKPIGPRMGQALPMPPSFQSPASRNF